MRADVSRTTFRTLESFSRVLQQQGRVLLESDSNEQVSILLHFMRTLARDALGPYHRPAAGGFWLAGWGSPDHQTDFTISSGRMYVDGLLVENAGPSRTTLYSYKLQPYGAPTTEIEIGASYLAYLDVWESLVTALDDGFLREVALGSDGPDTAARMRVIWQLRLVPLSDETKTTPADNNSDGNEKLAPDAWKVPFEKLFNSQSARGALKASLGVVNEEPARPCTLSPGAIYRGGNQLWRVEVHRGGSIGDEAPPTFKVSADNGSVVYKVVEMGDGTAQEAGTVSYNVTVASLGRDPRTALAEGDWVELVDEAYDFGSASNEYVPDGLLQVTSIDVDTLIVELSGPASSVAQRADAVNLRLRRWDQSTVLREPRRDDPAGNGTFDVVTAATKLDVGIVLQFLDTVDGQKDGTKHVYRRGDYWLIPGRESTGSIEWSEGYESPRGITHHYAPLAQLEGGTGAPTINMIDDTTLDPATFGKASVDEF